MPLGRQCRREAFALCGQFMRRFTDRRQTWRCPLVGRRKERKTTGDADKKGGMAGFGGVSAFVFVLLCSYGWSSLGFGFPPGCCTCGMALFCFRGVVSAVFLAVKHGIKGLLAGEFWENFSKRNNNLYYHSAERDFDYKLLFPGAKAEPVWRKRKELRSQ